MLTEAGINYLQGYHFGMPLAGQRDLDSPFKILASGVPPDGSGANSQRA